MCAGPAHASVSAGLGGVESPGSSALEVFVSAGKHLGRGALQHEFRRDPFTNSHFAQPIKKIKGHWPGHHRSLFLPAWMRLELKQ